ncbi:MAG: hydroxymethylpyrimidine/phosphomethylpyrimidine kinase [Ghiorsea sp.]
MEQRPICLTVGGSDSCGGAGVQADLRVFEALSIKGCSATTALTAQNPEHILHIQASSIEHFTTELQAITSYYDVQCFKTGMLFDQDHLNALLPFLHDRKVVIDPVLISSSGKKLFDETTAKAAYEELIPLATLWTPNFEEASFFLGQPIKNTEQAAKDLQNQYQTPVLLKGGHGNSEILQDTFCNAEGIVHVLTHHTQHLTIDQSHGTGCRLASAIAVYLALNHSLEDAILNAHQWLQSDLKH